ncbi:hypothetical protein, partial [Kutzneria sp. NPDC051319]|uniref:hypothetical protein n=1 Tax=Kutzneria sp. NPDC051319 TaxID=3155047 RepID=UPI00343BF4E7
MGELRMAMIQGGTDRRLDGVADYTGHLVPALREVGVDVVELAAGADLVHVQHAPFGFPDGMGEARFPAPLVTTLHEYDETLV